MGRGGEDRRWFGGLSWAAEAGRSIPGPKLSGCLATRAARRSNGSDEPIRMSGANHSGAGGGEAASSLPLPLCPQDLRSGGGLGIVRCPGSFRVLTAAPKRPLRVPSPAEPLWARPFPARVRAVTLSETRTGGARTCLATAPGEGAGGLAPEPRSGVVVEGLRSPCTFCRRPLRVVRAGRRRYPILRRRTLRGRE